MIIRPLLALVAKDLLVFFTDRYSVVLSIAAPIALASFMAAIFGGAGRTDASRLRIVIVDEDGGGIAASVLTGARSDPRLAATTSDRGPGLASVRKGESVAAVVISRGFGEAASEALLGGVEPPELLFFYDPTKRAELNLAQGLLTRIVLEAVAAESLGDLGGDLLDEPEMLGPIGRSVIDESRERAEFLALFPGLGSPEAVEPSLLADREEFLDSFPGLGDWFEKAGSAGESERPASSRKPPSREGLRMPYTVHETSITSGGPDGEQGALAAHAFAGMVVQFVLFSAVEWGVGLLVERQKGLWKRLRVAPVSRNTFLAGKVVGCLVASLLIVSVVFSVGSVGFGFRVRGDFRGLVIVAVAFAWMAANFGLMVAALGRSPQGARSIAVLAVLVMVMLGGGWIPSFLFPEWLRQFSSAIPTKWAIDGFDNIFSRGFTLVEAMPSILALTGFGVGFGTSAVVGFRWAEPS